jgi:hypothetical protein
VTSCSACLSFKGFRSEHPSVDLVHAPLPKVGATRCSTPNRDSDKTRSVAIHSLKDLDDAYQAVGELVDILSKGNLVSFPSRI